MNFLKSAAILGVVVALSACTGADRFGAGSSDGSSAAGVGAGGIDDPTSPAFFANSVGDRVLFAVDQSTLSGEAQATLDGQAAWLAQNPEYSALVEGHADEQGTTQYNIALGARRASAVQNYLISMGVAPSRLKTISYGKERPIEICSEEACYQQNRRSVTVLTAGAGI